MRGGFGPWLTPVSISLIDRKILAKVGLCGFFRPDHGRQLIVFSAELTANSLSDRIEN
jgi:hypothetical protein